MPTSYRSLGTMAGGPRHRRRRLAAWVIPAALSVGMFSATPAQAETGQVTEASAESQKKAQSIARQTMSPFCPGRTLSDCPSEHAAAWRQDIQRMVERGDSPQQIQEELERRAGGDLSGSPHRGAGYGLSLGLAALAIAFLFGLLRWLKGRSQEGTAVSSATPSARPSSEPPPVTTSEAALDERLDQELADELDDDDDSEESQTQNSPR